MATKHARLEGRPNFEFERSGFGGDRIAGEASEVCRIEGWTRKVDSFDATKFPAACPPQVAREARAAKNIYRHRNGAGKAFWSYEVSFERIF